MSEQWYVLAYDIRQAKRLQRLHYAIKKEATALQNSVFLFQADHKKLMRIKQMVKKHTHTQQDDVRLYPLKHPDSLFSRSHAPAWECIRRLNNG